MIRPGDISVEVIQPSGARTFSAQEIRNQYGHLYTDRFRTDTTGTITANVRINSSDAQGVATVSYAARPDARVDLSAIISTRNPAEWCGFPCSGYTAFPIQGTSSVRTDSIFLTTSTWPISRWLVI